MKVIKHQLQPTPDTCTSACLAMILDIPVDEVVKEFHQDWVAGDACPTFYLIKKQAKFSVHREPFDNTLKFGKVYLLTVPSLNLAGRNHHIVVDMRWGKGQETVYDPNNGRRDKAYYIGWTRGPRETEQYPLTSWTIDLIIEVK